MPDPSGTPDVLIWRSGDFAELPRRQPPFNGVEIEAGPVYDASGKLASLAITVRDFTNDATGATLETSFEPAVNGESLRLTPSGDFTVSGALDLRLLAARPTDIVVLVAIDYGLAKRQQHAEGGILGVPLEAPSAAKAIT